MLPAQRLDIDALSATLTSRPVAQEVDRGLNILRQMLDEALDDAIRPSDGGESFDAEDRDSDQMRLRARSDAQRLK
jgi:hypothetical protein